MASNPVLADSYLTTRMRIIDTYVLRQIFKPLWIALVVALLVLLIERMLRLLDLVLGAQGPLKVVFEIMAYLVPNYISLALPMSLLLGVMLAFNRLSRDGEIDAMQGAGVSLARQSRAALLAAIGVAVITMIALGYLKPYGRYAYETLVFTVANATFQAFVQAGVFTHIQDTTFLIKHVRPGDGAFANVFLYEGSQGGSTVVTARSGVLARPGDEAIPMLRLFDGIRLTIRDDAREEKQADDRALPVGVLRFQELRMTLGEGEAKFFRPRGADEREFTLSELWRRRFQPPPGVRVVRHEGGVPRPAGARALRAVSAVDGDTVGPRPPPQRTVVRTGDRYPGADYLQSGARLRGKRQ